MLCFPGNLTGGSRRLQSADVKGACHFRHASVKKNQAEEENETARGQVDRDLRSRGITIPASPDSDQEKSRNEGDLVKGIEEEKIERGERSHGPARDEQKAGVKG